MKINIFKLLDIILLVCWIITGTINIFTEVSKFSYACLLICFICEVAIKIIKNDYDDTNNNRSLAA